MALEPLIPPDNHPVEQSRHRISIHVPSPLPCHVAAARSKVKVKARSEGKTYNGGLHRPVRARDAAEKDLC